MKTFKEKNEQEKQQQTNKQFFQTFSNLNVGQYNLFSNFSTKQNTTERGITVIVSELHFYSHNRSSVLLTSGLIISLLQIWFQGSFQ